MHLVRTLRSLGIFALFLSSTTHGQSTNGSSRNTFITAVNATGSITVPGFGPLYSSGQNGTLTISTGIQNVHDRATNTSVVRQTFWLDAKPLISTNLADLPLWACAVFLMPANYPTSSNASDCAGYLTSDCYNEIVASANGVVAGGPYGGLTTCSAIVNAVSAIPACQGRMQLEGSLSSLILGNPTTSSSRNSTDGYNPLNGSATNGLFGFAHDADSVNSYTEYDKRVKTTSPFLLTAWSRNSTDQAAAFADSRFVCLTPDNVEAGSRDPSTSGARRTWDGVAHAKWLLGATVLLTYLL